MNTAQIYQERIGRLLDNSEMTYEQRKTQEERDRFKAALIALDRMADKLPLELRQQVQDVIYFDADLIFDADRMQAESESRKGAKSA